MSSSAPLTGGWGFSIAAANIAAELALRLAAVTRIRLRGSRGVFHRVCQGHRSAPTLCFRCSVGHLR